MAARKFLLNLLAISFLYVFGYIKTSDSSKYVVIASSICIVSNKPLVLGKSGSTRHKVHGLEYQSHKSNQIPVAKISRHGVLKAKWSGVGLKLYSANNWNLTVEKTHLDAAISEQECCFKCQYFDTNSGCCSCFDNP